MSELWRLAGDGIDADNYGCPSPTFSFVHLHGTLMYLAWGLLLPLGALVGRYYRWTWPCGFILHVIFQVRGEEGGKGGEGEGGKKCVCVCVCVCVGGGGIRGRNCTFVVSVCFSPCNYCLLTCSSLSSLSPPSPPISSLSPPISSLSPPSPRSFPFPPSFSPSFYSISNPSLSLLASS